MARQPVALDRGNMRAFRWLTGRRIMRTPKAVASFALVAAVFSAAGATRAGAVAFSAQTPGAGGLEPAYLDQLLAPVALYPDALLAQILLCSGNARKVTELAAWLKQNAQIKGSE